MNPDRSRSFPGAPEASSRHQGPGLGQRSATSRGRPGSGGPLLWKDHPLRKDLLAVYAEVDALVASGGFRCDGSTDCCHFGRTGREPYPTAIEIEEIQKAARALGGRSFAQGRGAGDGREGARGGRGQKRRLPVAGSPAEEGRCPFLSGEGRCRIYAARPFGCRTFFCDRLQGEAPWPRARIQELSRRIVDLSARFHPRDPGPRPLTRVF